VYGAADGPVAAIQESLKRQQYYSGEINGNFDDATRAAVRRFQIRQSLKVTGELDAATLEGLAAGEKALAAEASSSQHAEELVPARERARQMVQEDRKFLEQVEEQDSSARSEAAREGAVPTAPAPSTQSPRISVEPSPQQSFPERNPLDAGRPPRPQDKPPRADDNRRETTSADRVPREKSGISADEARQLVEDYLSAAEGPTPQREVSFYADRVDYFDSGRVGREFIERDQKNYYRRWPQREFTLVGDPELLRSTEEEATVRFRIRYNVSKGEETARGQTDNVVTLRRAGDGLKIVGIRERKVQ